MRLLATLIVVCRSTPAQTCDDFDELLLRLVPMLDLVFLRGVPSAHFGKELHCAKLVGELGCWGSLKASSTGTRLPSGG